MMRTQTDDQESGKEPDDRSGPVLDEATAGGDADETGDRAVAGHADIERLGLDPDQEARADAHRPRQRAGCSA